MAEQTTDKWTDNFIFNGKTFGLFNIRNLEQKTGYNFFGNLPIEIQNAIEVRNVPDIKQRINSFGTNSAPLMAEELSLSKISSVTPLRLFDRPATWHDSHPDQVSSTTNLTLSSFSTLEISSGENAIVGTTHFATTHLGKSSIDLTQITACEVGATQDTATDISRKQIGIADNGIVQTTFFEGGSSQIGSSQIGSSQIDFLQIGSPQVSSTQVGSSHIQFKSDIGSSQHNISQNHTLEEIVQLGFAQSTPTQFNQFNTVENSFSSIVPFDQLISSHFSHNSSSLLSNIYSTAQSIWHTNTSIDLNFEITNLPTGQLAEATITGYDQLGRPNTATISIDNDANGIGWFIDTTPGDNSEFTGTDTYFQATPNSPASGKYDLLTAILHEMGHTLGFINGYNKFNQNIKGRQFYTDPTHSYTLSSDLSHLDNTLYPNDLLNTNLKPGVRKLPSTMDWAIINAISGTGRLGDGGTGGTVNPAHLTAGALIGITNGDFTTPTTWDTLGATNIINGTATLTEQSQKLSELTQAFIIPTGAKTLQFTIKDNHLVTGDTTKTANDAFEVALLDTNTFNPLAGTSIGLNHTDSLLNIQANGTIHKSDKVTITALTNNSSIVTIDLTQVTPSTEATLYFNLLGFGSDGQISNLATVNLTVNNLPPTIQTVTIPTKIAEGQTINLTATATDGGSSNNLTYTWNLGDGTNPITGRDIAHTYADNGNYEVNLTVTDKDGGST